MFKRLFVLLLLVAATVSVSTPARASAPSVSLYCEQSSGGPSFGTFFCYYTVSGGTPSYTSQWYEYAGSTGYFLVQQGGTEYASWCQTNVTTRVRVVVTDSAGLQGEAIRYFKCTNPY